MYYLPSNLLNQNYQYYYNNNYFIVRTNQNCYTNYNTQYCDCFNVFQNNAYLVSQSYSCTAPNQQYQIAYNKFTNDQWYRNDLSDGLIIFLIMFIFMIYLPYKICSRLFGRWLKV